MWEFYLACSEVAFRYFGLMVFQIQLARRQEAVPLTRDYLARGGERSCAPSTVPTGRGCDLPANEGAQAASNADSRADFERATTSLSQSRLRRAVTAQK